MRARARISTSFGTALREVNLTSRKYIVEKDVTVDLDSNIPDVLGTKKTFIAGSVIQGTLWQEINRAINKKRHVVMVEDVSGRYLVPAKVLREYSQGEAEMKSQLDKLGGKIEGILSQAKEEATDIVKNPSDFFEKKYAGFTGKQILIGALGVIILVKIFK